MSPLDLQAASPAPANDVRRSTSPKEGRPRILAILPRGEAIRNFVYTDTLDEVAARADVSVLSVDPGPELWDMLVRRYGDVRRLEEIPERWAVRILREFLDMAHGRHLWSKAAQERWRRRDAEATAPPLLAKRVLKKLGCAPFASRSGINLLSRIERVASRRLRTTEYYIDLLRSIRPALVFNGSHVHSRVAIQAVQAALWLGIPTATFIFSWDNLTSQGRIIPHYDHYLVWSKGLRDQLLEIYDTIRPDQVSVTGTPQFDFHFRQEFFWSRDEFCRRVGADPARPIVLYSTGMANHMPGEPRIVEQIADMLGVMPKLGPPQLLVRVYPKDRTGRFEELERRRPDILFPEIPWEPAWLTPKPEDLPLLTNMIRHASAGINVASTITLELCMFNKPVINVGYNPTGIDIAPIDYRRYYEFDHYRPVVESGAVAVAYSPEEMPDLIIGALTNPGTQAERRRTLMQRMFDDTLDGRTASRVAERLVCLGSGECSKR